MMFQSFTSIKSFKASLASMLKRIRKVFRFNMVECMMFNLVRKHTADSTGVSTLHSTHIFIKQRSSYINTTLNNNMFTCTVLQYYSFQRRIEADEHLRLWCSRALRVLTVLKQAWQVCWKELGKCLDSIWLSVWCLVLWKNILQKVHWYPPSTLQACSSSKLVRSSLSTP